MCYFPPRQKVKRQRHNGIGDEEELQDAVGRKQHVFNDGRHEQASFDAVAPRNAPATWPCTSSVADVEHNARGLLMEA